MNLALTTKKATSGRFTRATMLIAMAVLALLPALAMADDFTTVSNTLIAQMTSAAGVLTGAFFLVGIGLAGLSILKFKAHNENPQQTKLTTPLALAVAAACLIAFPAFTGVIRHSVLNGGQANSFDTTTYQQIGN